MSPLLRDIPEQIDTERLLIRCPRPGDGAAVHEAVVETLAELRAWPASLPWAQFEPSVDASEAHCRQAHAGYLLRQNLPLLVFAKQGGGLVGSSGLHAIDWAVPKFELGYWGRLSCHGQGLMGEATRAIVQWAFDTLGARRVTALTDAANAPSRRLAERAGLVLEGVMRHERATPDGTLRDTCLYARVA